MSASTSNVTTVFVVKKNQLKVLLLEPPVLAAKFKEQTGRESRHHARDVLHAVVFY